MSARGALRVLIFAAVAFWTMGASAAAQITTATISGSIRDSTGAALPGATVILTSETRGTRLADAVTNSNGDFVLPNITADTYIIEVTLAGFKALQRSGIAVSPGDRLVVPPITLEVGALQETVHVTAESPLIQLGSGERSFTVATEAVQTEEVGHVLASSPHLGPDVDDHGRLCLGDVPERLRVERTGDGCAVHRRRPDRLCRRSRREIESRRNHHPDRERRDGDECHVKHSCLAG